MAPEVYLGRKYDLKADVYSLGFILYYIIGGKKPFYEYNVDTIRIYMENAELIHSLDIIKDRKWRDLINNCIQKDIEERCDVNTLFENITNITNNAHNNENKPCLIS
jgi:serine/threonine protein kinase